MDLDRADFPLPAPSTVASVRRRHCHGARPGFPPTSRDQSTTGNAPRWNLGAIVRTLPAFLPGLGQTRANLKPKRGTVEGQ